MSNSLSDKADDAKRQISNEDTTISKEEVVSAHGVPDIANLAQANLRGLRAPEIIARLTPEQRVELENRLRRKIDWRLLPMIIIMYILNYIDRNNIAAAKLAGLPEDLNLDPNSSEFQTAVSILFVG
ncbi:uncharacterized protein F4807DRAFT_418352 [Annulohypoxylon truncatum]|uniref:uncharacterized protein n=1 Tax=Annulohypoxylon truncatum TaxID=327061 RepID=UPI0020073AC6|nr:uncharacterized protein F4807DRAFT_418352 [Annulohypoxylon truncatum]KAI1211587.1 hypothetical protein F4807DRAFT_418352 [Annulohypoxylon truncatum]